MGYRSDVRIVIRGPKELMLREFASLRVTGDDTMRAALDEWVVMEDKPIVYRPIPTEEATIKIDAAVAVLGKGGVDWKWYPDYADVRAHESVWSHFQGLYDGDKGDNNLELDPGLLDGAFVRIGEDDNDIETRHFGDDGYDLAAAQRYIVCEYDDLDRADLRPRLVPSSA